jgi:hypothetical protein
MTRQVQAGLRLASLGSIIAPIPCSILWLDHRLDPDYAAARETFLSQ